MGGVRVQVDEEDLARAREVLKDVLPQTARGMFTCPKCGSDSVEYGQKAKQSIFLSLLLIGFPFPWFKPIFYSSKSRHVDYERVTDAAKVLANTFSVPW